MTLGCPLSYQSSCKSFATLKAGGDKAYHEASYTNVGFANFHNHANTKYTVGMGEVAVVLNGVEFWTRHNVRCSCLGHLSFCVLKRMLCSRFPHRLLASASAYTRTVK
jgi:hypothetical protein